MNELPLGFACGQWKGKAAQASTVDKDLIHGRVEG